LLQAAAQCLRYAVLQCSIHCSIIQDSGVRSAKAEGRYY
jgi:hypothetical protein